MQEADNAGERLQAAAAAVPEVLPGVARCSLLSAATRSLSESPGERQSFAFCHFVCSTGIAEATRTPKARRLQHVALGDLEDTQGAVLDQPDTWGRPAEETLL